jgi:hypothetical protein
MQLIYENQIAAMMETASTSETSVSIYQKTAKHPRRGREYEISLKSKFVKSDATQYNTKFPVCLYCCIKTTKTLKPITKEN